MSMEKLVEFLGSVSKKTDTKVFEESSVAAKASTASAGDLAQTATMLVDAGAKKGYSFTQADVLAYLEQVKTLYYTSSPVKVLMDAFCTTSCHIGSQIQKA